MFLYNQQVTDTLTRSFLSLAAKYHVPVVGVYETMPRGIQLPVMDARRGPGARARRDDAGSTTKL